MNSLRPELRKFINQISIIEDGIPTRYCLKSRRDTSHEQYRKISIGERDKNKPHKKILMVGETGTGKTTLINAMINYMLDVKREDKVWFEITDDQSDRTSAHSQTSIITVYGFYLPNSQIDLTVIDTPGYGDTCGIEKDKQIGMSLHSLSKSAEGIHKIHAVCLVIKATQNRLSDKQQYILDAVQSLFGKDIAENIVLLFTHSNGMPPKNALMAVKEAKIKCAVNDKNQPVYFLFDNCQSDTADKEYEMIKEQSWNLTFRGTEEFFKFLKNKQKKSLEMTQNVLQQREHLEAKINNLQSQIQLIEKKQNELKTFKAALEQNNTNFEYEAEVTYKEQVEIDPYVAKEATCCTVCEENCHYPGCWWVRDLSWCSVMRNNYCKVCTNKCHYKKHIKGAMIYVTKTKKEKKTFEDIKKKYENETVKSGSLIKKLEEELQELEHGKIKLVNEAFHCVETLETFALNTESLFTLQHIDYLIEKLKEINEPEKAKTLEEMKKRAGQEKLRALSYIKK